MPAHAADVAPRVPIPYGTERGFELPRIIGLTISEDREIVRHEQQLHLYKVCPPQADMYGWHPQMAASSETMPMNKALDHWNIEACYVEHLDHVIQTLSDAGIYFDEQT